MFAKAQIVPLDAGHNKQQPIECMFNPKEYTISRTIEWETQSNDTTDTGNKVYKGGSAAQLTLELFFDTYANRKSSGQVEDVRKYTERLWALTKMEEKNQPTGANKSVKKALPPTVLFQWGSTWHFAAVIKSMEQQFTLFMPDGMPVRSIIKVTLEQSDTATHFHGSSGSSGVYKVESPVRRQIPDGQNADHRNTPLGKGMTAV